MSQLIKILGSNVTILNDFNINSDDFENLRSVLLCTLSILFVFGVAYLVYHIYNGNYCRCPSLKKDKVIGIPTNTSRFAWR